MNSTDLRLLAERASTVEGRQAVRLAEVHGRIRSARRRRAVTAAVASVALVAGSIGAIALWPTATERPPEVVDTPTPTPTPTPDPTPSPSPKVGSVKSLSPREVVTAENAQLLHAASSAENPDVRISIWEAVCELCPIPFESQLHPSFKGMALTTDGYRTADYTRSPFPQGPPYRIESLADNQFLLVDEANGQEVMVDIDGTIRRVTRVATPISSPRSHWFQCLSTPFVGDTSTWCALDPVTATAYPIPPSGGEPSVNAPDSNELTWGLRSTYPRGHVIWWERNGSREEVELVIPTTSRRGVLSGRAPASWVIDKGSKSLDLHVVDPLSGQRQVITRPAPDAKGSVLEMIVTPEGGLLAVSTWSDNGRPVPLIWRAPTLTADFELVYDDRLVNQPVDIDRGGVRVIGDRIYVGSVGLVESFDDGRTWSGVTTWR
jgi:hypothetical protein